MNAGLCLLFVEGGGRGIGVDDRRGVQRGCFAQSGSETGVGGSFADTRFSGSVAGLFAADIARPFARIGHRRTSTGGVAWTVHSAACGGLPQGQQGILSITLAVFAG